MSTQDTTTQDLATYGVFGAHLPGNESTRYYAKRANAVECARDTNRQPWNRGKNRALLITLASGAGTRSY